MNRPFILTGAALLSCLACSVSNAQEINLRKTVAVEVVQRTKDSVVNISAHKIVQRMSPMQQMNPFWEGINGRAAVEARSLGSGFIVHPDGYVVTNNHVIDRAREIEVELSDGRKLKADLVSSDPESDLAILKVNSDKPLPIIELGDSGDLMIGEPAIAVGNPLGYSHTVSTGIVSALHRDLEEEQATLRDLIQTDAAINPGNSGGPLLNAYGQVIGIDTAIRSDAQNIGFAIGVNKLRQIIPDLMSPTQAKKVDVPIKLMEKRALTPPDKIACQVVTADDAQRPIARINGQSPKNIVDAYAILLRVQDGDTVTVDYADGKQDKLTATAAPLPDAIVQAKSRLGLTVEPLTPMLAQKYQIAQEDGLLVTKVDAQSIAARAGVRPQDIIVGIGRYRVAKLDDFSLLMQHLPTSGRVRIGVIRGDQMGYGMLNLTPTPPPQPDSR